jgi:hypothetical protein
MKDGVRKGGREGRREGGRAHLRLEQKRPV